MTQATMRFESNGERVIINGVIAPRMIPVRAEISLFVDGCYSVTLKKDGKVEQKMTVDTMAEGIIIGRAFVELS